VLFAAPGTPYSTKQVRGMMRRKTQDIPDAPHAIADMRPPHGASLAAI
jgi:hypothetical protein